MKGLTGGVATLFQGNGVTSLPGTGKLLAGRKVEFQPHDGPRSVLEARARDPGAGLRAGRNPAGAVDRRTSSSTRPARWNSKRCRRRLGVIGAGVIGLELGSVWSRLGAEVVILEALEEFLPMVDERIAREAHKIFDGQGLDIRLGARVMGPK